MVEERQKIADHLELIREFLVECGFKSIDLRRDLGDCIKELLGVIETQKRNLKYPNDKFDILWSSGRLQDNIDEWANTVIQAARISDDGKDIDTLCFDPSCLSQISTDLTDNIKAHLIAIEKELGDQENPGGAETGGSKEDLLNELKQIYELLDRNYIHAESKTTKNAP